VLKAESALRVIELEIAELIENAGEQLEEDAGFTEKLLEYYGEEVFLKFCHSYGKPIKRDGWRLTASTAARSVNWY
jgi:hypothetical protein